MKVRVLSPNILDSRERGRRMIDVPVLGYIILRWKAFKTWVLNTVRRRKNIVRMKALTRSEWYDCDTRIFEANFQILVDYVEGELAWMQLIADNKDHWYHRWLPIKNARELAMKYLEWESQLGDDSPLQAHAAHEVRSLYLWYKDERATRPDPHDEIPARPWNFEEDENGELFLPSLHEDKEFVAAVKKAQEIEEGYEEEDTAQLVRLVRIRRMMWT